MGALYMLAKGDPGSYSFFTKFLGNCLLAYLVEFNIYCSSYNDGVFLKQSHGIVVSFFDNSSYYLKPD